MTHRVYKALDKPASFLCIKGRFILIPLLGAVVFLVATLLLQTVLPLLPTCLLTLCLILIPSIVIGFSLQDKYREKDFWRVLLFPSRRLRIIISPSQIDRLYRSKLLEHFASNQQGYGLSNKQDHEN